MDEISLDKHIEIDNKALQVQALTNRANLALDTLNFLRMNETSPEVMAIPKINDLKAAAVETLISYFGQS